MNAKQIESIRQRAERALENEPAGTLASQLADDALELADALSSAAGVIEAAERLIDTYTLDMQDASLGDVITHLHLLNEDIHALARAIAVYRVATDPSAADDAG